MYGGNLIKHFTDDNNNIESQGIEQQLGGNLTNLAVPAGLLIVNHLYKNNTNITKINKNEVLDSNRFDLFLKNNDITIKKTRKKRIKKKRSTRKKV
tara:strand:- start:1964 stop:2251 length:288 start_codon:yes stop_codon:yes gene_type:complete